MDAKPSHIVTLNRADVLIEGGAELELGWLPPLLESARNDKIAAGAPGRIVASQGRDACWRSRRRSTAPRATCTRWAIRISCSIPLNVKLIAAQIADHFAQVDPANRRHCSKPTLQKFNATLDAKLAEWQKQLAPYRGAKIVTYHKDFVYLAERFDLEVVETLEPKPGIAPSPAHLAKVIGTMKAATARVILVQPYQNRKTAETVARQTGRGGAGHAAAAGRDRKDTDTYFELMDYIVRTLADGVRRAQMSRWICRSSGR